MTPTSTLGHTANLVRALTPYRLCVLVAKISARFEGEPTIGELADFWLNQHVSELL